MTQRDTPQRRDKRKRGGLNTRGCYWKDIKEKKVDEEEEGSKVMDGDRRVDEKTRYITSYKKKEKEKNK